MTKTNDLVEAFRPFLQMAYADGQVGENRGAWERFADESVAALRGIAGKEPSPASVKFIRTAGDECLAAWEVGRKRGHHAKG